MIQALIAHLVTNYQGMIEGAALTYAFTHIPQGVAFLFHQAMRWPWLRAQVLADPKRAKAIVDQIQQELDRDIDTESAQAAAPTPAVKP